jgi:hypothetical protein
MATEGATGDEASRGKAELKGYLEACIQSGALVSGTSMRAHVEGAGELYRENWTRNEKRGGDPELRGLYERCPKRHNCNKSKGSQEASTGAASSHRPYSSPVAPSAAVEAIYAME